MSLVRKRSVKIAGHSTSVSLEDPFWQILSDIAAEQKRSLNLLIEEVDAGRGEDENLSSALRVFVLHSLLAKCMG
ncbi:MAG: ribbon-helix-helix domain-containing protein [Alphaproteobacteria bacterium]|nr:ribbon-helix-helix domain-containing protein [Alphaproteobacteria bacterium]